MSIPVWNSFFFESKGCILIPYGEDIYPCAGITPFIYGIYFLVAFSINVGTYYIDRIGLPFWLQIIYMALENEDIMENKIKLYMVGILSGIAIGIKITQAFFVMPIIIYIIFKNRKYRIPHCKAGIYEK